jgi:hypothetical protein
MIITLLLAIAFYNAIGAIHYTMLSEDYDIPTWACRASFFLWPIILVVLPVVYVVIWIHEKREEKK